MIYGIIAFIYVLYNFQTTYIHTAISPRGHLTWNWTQYTRLPVSFYLFFLFFPLLYNKHYISLIFLFIFFALIYYIGKGYGSLWCLFVNSIFIYFLLELLVISTFLTRYWRQSQFNFTKRCHVVFDNQWQVIVQVYFDLIT